MGGGIINLISVGEFHKRQEGRITFTINPTFLPPEHTGPYRPFSKVNSLPTQETGIAFSEAVGTGKSKMMGDPKPIWAALGHGASVCRQQHS